MKEMFIFFLSIFLTVPMSLGFANAADEIEYLSLHIEFDPDEAVVHSQFYDELDRIVRLLKDNPRAKARIEGYTDSRPISSELYKKKLSKHHAQAVMNYMLKAGIEQSRLTAVTHGFTKPIAPNDSQENRRHNHRIEIYIEKPVEKEDAREKVLPTEEKRVERTEAGETTEHLDDKEIAIRQLNERIEKIEDYIQSDRAESETRKALEFAQEEKIEEMSEALHIEYSPLEEEDAELIKWSGYLKTDNRMRLEKDNEISFHEYRLGLKLDASPGEEMHVHGELWLRSTGFSETEESSDLSNKDKVSPWNLDIREAYVDVYGFLFDNTDLRIGRQRIAWGTGDKLNPTDNINPDDLEDIWDFGRHLGSDALKITCYIGDFTLTGVYVPVFTPAVMPSGDWATVLSPSMELPPGMTLGTVSDTILLPENSFKESSKLGFKVATTILMDLDLSISYVYGRDDIPVINKVTLAAAAQDEVDINSELIFPRLHIAGIDIAGSISDIGIWAECAVFFSEDITGVIDLSNLGMPNQESIVSDDEKPYTKYVIGADYTFRNGIYINGQYLHGFVHERGRDNLEDYLMFGIEHKSFNDKIKIIPIQGGVEIKDFDNIEDNYALIYSPELNYYPYDNVEVTLGAYIIDGKDTTTFGKVDDLDELFLKVKGYF
jgi:hypothetical protein